MSSVEKRHVSHRMGSMLHHRFPNGFTDLFMDETDREVSILTDRAFRSLCVGDDAVYNDEFLYGYSPFSCHKPLVGDPLKKTHHKESKKHGQSKNEKNNSMPWKQQHHTNISNMSSFLKAFSVTEKSCEGLLNKNGDTNGESWDKSALRSIQRELSEFSSDYHANMKDRKYRNHHGHSEGGTTDKTDNGSVLSSGKSTKVKNGKTTVKLKKLNIKNFFLHSEFSPFQSWRDFNQFPFGQEETVPSILPMDTDPKWYDLPFYKKLTDSHRKEMLHTAESESCQKVELPAVEPPPTAPKPIPPPPPPKVLPKPSGSPAEKRCSSHAGEGTATPWRRNRSRATSAVPVNQPGIPSQDRDTCSRTADESFSVVKKEVKSVEVKAIEECSSVASTPFSICQLMTPVIPSRQPTDTSEILSPSVLDIQLRPNSEAKGTPEPTIKRDGYKSLASSILFNLKDNRKRVKSRYSPPKFKTLELPEDNVQSPSISDDGKLTHGNVSGLNTPAILKDGQTVCSPILESPSTPTATFSKHTESHLSDDYLLSNLLQSKKEVVGEENLMSPFLQPKKHRSPAAKRQNYPSLHLYRKAPQEDTGTVLDTRYLQVPPNGFGPVHSGSDELSPLMLDKEFPPQVSQTDKELSPNIVTVNQDQSRVTSPHVIEKDKLSPNIQVGISCLMEPDKAEDEEFGFQSISRRKESGSQAISTMDVIRAAKEAINATKNKARSAAHVPENNKPFSDVEEMEQRDLEEKDGLLMDRDDKKREKTVPEDIFISKNRSESAKITPEDKHSFVKQPPPVPRRNFSKSDVDLAVDKHLPNVSEKSTDYDSVEEKLDLPQKAYESISEPTKAKHIFSARLNNYIKNQRCAAVDEEEVRNSKRYEENVNMRTERDEKVYVGDSEHICNDLQALKELERARFGDRVLDNAKNKFGLVNIDKEARVKSDLISKELRNIKRGMLSMRGNTSIKRDIFAKKDKDQEKQEDFPVMDNNVIVNKALINENYDKAKMALEEIISEREKRKKKSTEDAIIDEKVSEERFVKRTQQSKHIMKDSKVEGKEKMSSSSMQKETDIRDRLTDLRDHNLVRQILSHAEPRLGESHRLGGRIALPGMDRAEPQLKTQGKLVINKLADNPTNNLEEEDKVYVERRVSEESAESVAQEIRCQPLDTPRVPPRNKRIGGRRHDSISMLDEDSFYKTEMSENCETGMNNISSTHLEKQEVDSNLLLEGAGPVQSPPISGYDMQSRPTLGVTPKFRGDTMEANDLQKNLSPSWDTMFENSNTKPEDAPKSKQMTLLKTDHSLILDHRAGKVFEVDEVSKRSNLTQDIGADTEAVSETPRSIISPTLMVNGVSINQSPPDQSSLSSKSSYFSVDSALQRKEDVESYVYHSLENMIRDLDKEMLCTSPNTKQDSDRTEYYSLSDHESEPELMRSQIASPLKQTQVPHNDNKERTTFTEQSATHEQDDETTMSPTNTLSPTLGIPSLFKVKDNTFNGKTKKTAQTWAPKTTILQRSEEEVPQEKAAPKLSAIITPEEYIEPKQFVINHSPPVLSELSNLQDKNPKKPQLSNFLTVPQEDSGFSGASPLSEEVESLTTSTVDTVEEIKISTSVPVDHEVSKVPSERSGSTCSGNDSQTGLPKPPAVLPKSEKAVLKAIKLTNRRIKKEEAQKTPHKSSHNSSSKHRSERHKSDKSEQKPSTSRSGSKGSERKHREKREDDQHHHHHHHSTTGNDTSEQISHEKRGHSIDHTLKDKTQVNSISHRQNLDFLDSNKISKEDLSSVDNERQGRSSNRNVRDKSRRYSVDRVFSNVPVYKAHVGEKSVADRPSNRSQSYDRQVGDKAQRRFSADMSINEKLNTRSQHIEKSIMDGLQQRGRVRDKAPRENIIRRSHSIDAYSTEAPQPPTFSRQSSHNSQLSRQSSYEHAIVTQSFPVTQRKLLQDPDSGQYFVVDMPVQIKTKTFFDPETGSYVQLPVQPQDGTIPQPSPMEVLRSPPLVVYHGFVPVPLSPMAQKTTIQTVSVDPEEFEQRHLERSRQKHCREGQPYLEPVFGQHDHFLGEFMSTEELDCPS